MTKKYCTYQSVAITTDSTSPVIDITNFSSGEVVIPNSTTTVTLTYFVVQPAGVYYTAYDSTPAAISQTVAANRAYPLPAAIFGAGAIQIRGNVAGTIGLILKS